MDMDSGGKIKRTLIVVNTKENINMTGVVAKVFLIGKMEIFMMGILLMMSSMDLEEWNGNLLVWFMKVTGRGANSMELAK